MRRMDILLVLSGFLVLCSAVPAEGQGNGIIAGRVTDATDGTPLWGANVLLTGTSIGAVTNDEGRFRILQVPAGPARIAFRYLGYITVEREITVPSGQLVEVNVALFPDVLEQAEVVVTGQMKGQQAAINQQLSSNSIVNVVSQERIRELPDQNAAESLSRLPGVSVERNGGEAQKVIIRGLAPRFNTITINGEKIPSTDLEDRSVDLSSISSDMLVGIEVYKSPTADRDGDAVGGTVNFAMRKASEDPLVDVRLEGGMNSLEHSYSDYKGSANVGNRYFDNALGVVVTGTAQRADRGSDGQQAEYSLSREPAPGGPIPYQIDDMRLVDRKEIRERYGVSLALDYDLGLENTLFFTGFWSKTNRDEARRRERFNIQESRLEFDYMDHVIATQLFNVGLRGDHTVRLPVIGDMIVNWHASGSQSDQNNPFELYGRFFRMGLPGVVADQGPENVPPSVPLEPDNTWLKIITFSSERVIDRDYSSRLDAKSFYRLGDFVSGTLKFGGKFSHKSRERNTMQIIANTVIENDLGRAIYANPSAFYRSFPLTADVNHKVLMTGFQSGDDAIGEFLEGRYARWPTLDGGLIHEFWENMRYWVTPGGVPLFDNSQAAGADRLEANNSYTAGENILACYVMSELNIGKDIMILPGLRYEMTRNDYKALFGTMGTVGDETPSLVDVRDSTGESVHTNWLPMIQMRMNLTEGMSLRASVAKTLSRPNFFDLVPYEKIDRTGSPRTIEKGNPDLEYVDALNCDLHLSLFNQYGLFTIGGFYKRLDNVSYIRTSYIFSGLYSGYRLIQPVNAADPSYVYGGEIEVQANLTLLPEPFDGIIISGNFALMESRTLYPQFQVTNFAIPTPPFLIVSVVDTVREAPMPGQANIMGNIMLGYQRGGFSGRVSVMFQGKSLSVVGTRPETDGYTDAYYRWDLAVQQKLFGGISLYLNINNLTATSDRSSNETYLTSEQHYGWSGQLGIRYKL